MSTMHARAPVGAGHSMLRACTVHLSEVRLRRLGNVPGTPRGRLVCTRLGNVPGTPRGPRTTRRTRGGSSGPQGSVRSADPARPRAGNGTSRSAHETTHRPVPVQGPGGTEHDLETEGCGTPRRGRPHPGPTSTQPAVRAVRALRSGYGTYTKRARAGMRTGAPVGGGGYRRELWNGASEQTVVCELVVMGYRRAGRPGVGGGGGYRRGSGRGRRGIGGLVGVFLQCVVGVVLLEWGVVARVRWLGWSGGTVDAVEWDFGWLLLCAMRLGGLTGSR